MPRERGLSHARHRLSVLLAAYFGKPPGDLAKSDEATFVTKFRGFCNNEEGRIPRLDARDVDSWFAKDDSTILSKNQLSLVNFFKKKWDFFDLETLRRDLSDFETNFYKAAAAHERTLVIALGEPLGAWSEADHKYLCGVYELYRYAFANDGNVNVDVLIIRPDPVNPKRLQMEVIVRGHRQDGKHDRFVGIFCQYGNSLLGLPVYVNDEATSDATTTGDSRRSRNARVRRLEFPIESLRRTQANLVKIGIVSGNSNHVGAPVSAKCLIAKISNDPSRADNYVRIADRYHPRKLYSYYVEAISNDIRRDPGKPGEQDDYLLIARHSSHPPRLRPRTSDPPLPDDPADPSGTVWRLR
jgi:hypothetical protein